MVNIRPLSSELQKKASDELNEVEERIPEDLRHLKEWLKMQPHLKARTDDQWLMAFLRGCKYSLEKAKRKLDLFYSIRSIMPEYYEDRFPFSSALNDMLNMTTYMVLPQTTSPSLPRPTIILIRYDMCNNKNCTLTDAIRLNFMAVEIIMAEDDNAVVSGIDVIADYSQFTLNYAVQITPTVAKKLLIGGENAYPVRIKHIYVINAPPIFETLYSMGKVFLAKKMKNRVHIYSSNNTDELYKYIPKHVMPKEYGGDNASIHKLAGDFSNKMRSYGPWFLDDAKYGSNEALRSSNLRSPVDMLGIEGSFRKLNVD